VYVFTGVQYVRNYDGDTITVNIPGVHPLLGHEISVRVQGVDAPEIRGARCPEERTLALKAKQFVHDLLTQAHSIVLENVKRGKYFRLVAAVRVDGRDLSTLLLENHLAVPYNGGPRSGNAAVWCSR